jgi:hypothetical protein
MPSFTKFRERHGSEDSCDCDSLFLPYVLNIQQPQHVVTFFLPSEEMHVSNMLVPFCSKLHNVIASISLLLVDFLVTDFLTCSLLW